MRPTFGREYIENEFQRIGDGLSAPLTVYLIGGGAMSLRDLKGATKDIDLVVPDGDAYGQLWAVLMDLGYAEVQSLDPDYRALGATSCVENDDGCRLDIFNQQVANKLVLTDGMQERSEPFLDTDRLTVRLVSNEDIFLFKAIAGRDDDIEDMNMLVQAGLDYDVVRDELEAQIERLGDDQFATFANEALLGIADSAREPASMALFADEGKGSGITSSIGIRGLVWRPGALLAPLLGGYLMDSVGMAWVFLVGGGTALIGVVTFLGIISQRFGIRELARW
ncbi:DUF6036 family nucleotidyltransferase [Halomicrobium sp. IBSBa]|uniref:DUF6036 family nucleotidyltransferase n=1 Tax=Halomicrobium sp. IBSBa TaxID=2778916 RepID=UPI001FC9B47F|nr:DUF6036 family nucleotidyltransferase [Halomicrobium sp. IBSBa]